MYEEYGCDRGSGLVPGCDSLWDAGLYHVVEPLRLVVEPHHHVAEPLRHVVEPIRHAAEPLLHVPGYDAL